MGFKIRHLLKCFSWWEDFLRKLFKFELQEDVVSSKNSYSKSNLFLLPFHILHWAFFFFFKGIGQVMDTSSLSSQFLNLFYFDKFFSLRLSNRS